MRWGRKEEMPETLSVGLTTCKLTRSINLPLKKICSFKGAYPPILSQPSLLVGSSTCHK